MLVVVCLGQVSVVCNHILEVQILCFQVLYSSGLEPENEQIYQRFLFCILGFEKDFMKPVRRPDLIIIWL